MCTVECIKQKDGDAARRYLRPASGRAGGRRGQREVTSPVARHISGAQEIIAAANKGGHPSGLVRLLQPSGQARAVEKEVRQRILVNARRGQRRQEEGNGNEVRSAGPES